MRLRQTSDYRKPVPQATARQRDLKARGLCVRCGKPRDCPSKAFCRKHLLWHRAKYVKVSGGKWPGRHPLC